MTSSISICGFVKWQANDLDKKIDRQAVALDKKIDGQAVALDKKIDGINQQLLNLAIQQAEILGQLKLLTGMLLILWC